MPATTTGLYMMVTGTKVGLTTRQWPVKPTVTKRTVSRPRVRPSQTVDVWTDISVLMIDDRQGIHRFFRAVVAQVLERTSTGVKVEVYWEFGIKQELHLTDKDHLAEERRIVGQHKSVVVWTTNLGGRDACDRACGRRCDVPWWVAAGAPDAKIWWLDS